MVEAALGEFDFGNGYYVVPAIFLKYNADKIRNDYIEKGIVTTLDVATIALSGGTALATKVHWVRRAWALAEVVGATGNIVVSNTEVSADTKQIVDAYNLAMAGIGIKNLGQGGYKFVKNLPEQTKKLLQQNKGLRNELVAKYLEWQTLITKIDDLTDAEKRLIAQQEKVWKTLLGILPKNTYLCNPNMAENVRNAITNSGVSMEKFVNINYKASHGMASTEEIAWLQKLVTQYFPKPKKGDKLRKVMTEEDFVKYYKDVKNPTMIKGAGFITKVEDYEIPNSSEELIENLRLDYSGTKFSKEKGFVVIEYKNPTPNVEHPFNRSKINDDLPYTNTGMTGSKRNIIPEYHSTDIVTFSRGDILNVYDKNGIIIETYILEDLNGIKVWKRQ
ncbi:hypothetical protein CAPN010_04710 [Capnocytophaga cynodegmi]|uniref:hypothetical protein n=1 Tax=Capnocytophaga cynodegmi TaxID=28189 RepID=UPI001EE3400A|nr:hypothetical protein [Capnocytophaga cynodegmi]GJQ06313.1 hypothetical protein CAPN010_04710 [Capnocytophaga cynodegmi]